MNMHTKIILAVFCYCLKLSSQLSVGKLAYNASNIYSKAISRYLPLFARKFIPFKKKLVEECVVYMQH